MMYLLAIVFPPAAVLLCGKPIQAVLNLLLTSLGCLPGMIHACLVVSSYHADQRNSKLIEAMDRQNRP